MQKGVGDGEVGRGGELSIRVGGVPEKGEKKEN